MPEVVSKLNIQLFVLAIMVNVCGEAPPVTSISLTGFAMGFATSAQQEANLCRTLSDLGAVSLLLPPDHMLLVAARIALVTGREGKIHEAAHFINVFILKNLLFELQSTICDYIRFSFFVVGVEKPIGGLQLFRNVGRSNRKLRAVHLASLRQLCPFF